MQHKYAIVNHPRVADEPMVGMVVTISPSLSLYRIVVFPAASKPTIKIRISFFPHSLSNSFENVRPMITTCGYCVENVEVSESQREAVRRGSETLRRH